MIPRQNIKFTRSKVYVDDVRYVNIPTPDTRLFVKNFPDGKTVL